MRVGFCLEIFVVFSLYFLMVTALLQQALFLRANKLWTPELLPPLGAPVAGQAG